MESGGALNIMNLTLPLAFSGGGDYCLACQPPILPSSRQTKGMDASQTEFLNLACIKAMNRKSQSTGENVNELHNPHQKIRRKQGCNFQHVIIEVLSGVLGINLFCLCKFYCMLNTGLYKENMG